MFDELALWLSELPRWFGFMLALPFVVAFTGLLRVVVDERKQE